MAHVFLNHFRSVYSINRMSVLLLLLIPVMLGRAQLDPREDALNLLRRGDNYLSFGNWNEALDHYTQAISVDPELFHAYVRRASVLALLGNDQEANRDLNMATRITPFAMAFFDTRLFKKYLVYHYKDENDAYIDQLLYSEELLESDSLYQHNMDFQEAFRHYLNGEYLQSREKLESIGEEHYSATCLLLGSLLAMHFEEYERSGELALKVLERGSNAEASLILALVAKKKGDQQEAMARYAEIIEKEQGDVMLHYNRAYSLKMLGMYEEAYDLLNDYVLMHPDDPEGYNVRGCIHLVQRRYSEAIEDFTMALSYDAEYGAALVNRAMAHFSMYHYRDGCQDANEALRLGCKGAEALIKGMCNY